MRLLYTAILYLLTPLVLLRLVIRGLRAPAYWRGWGQRFGFIEPLRGGRPVWVHAVSVGEVQAALPLVRGLRERHPHCPLLVTTTTPTGAARIGELFNDSVEHVYLPYDLPGAVSRFLDRVQPRLALIIETEIWPNLFAACRHRDIPLMMVNARLSPRSAAGYRRVARLMRDTLGNVSVIAAHARADATRLTELGAPADRVRVTGNIKFDVQLPRSLLERADALRRQCGADRPVWIAASTHEGEDEIVLAAFQRVRERVPDALLMLVPRHPERFARVVERCRKTGYRVVQRSTNEPCGPETDVFVGDTMGELSLFYAAADVAFVGGSLIPSGGHNPLEPAAVGVPVVIGPHVFNFQEISGLLLDAGAARQVADADQLAAAVVDWLRDGVRRNTAGEAGQAVVESNRGALDAVLKLVEGYL
ncbi:MAG TPA: lipid IV(A) 3-deoxy-D-manno-octulosonic acid transferase [Gammaproteobacteria bacterium]|nr:lipid IV(A) 3-deoxy-D-manno-octulosonic acid transferase [Gammaproteobacteria bacterium]